MLRERSRHHVCWRREEMAPPWRVAGLRKNRRREGRPQRGQVPGDGGSSRSRGRRSTSPSDPRRRSPAPDPHSFYEIINFEAVDFSLVIIYAKFSYLRRNGTANDITSGYSDQ